MLEYIECIFFNQIDTDKLQRKILLISVTCKNLFHSITINKEVHEFENILCTTLFKLLLYICVYSFKTL